MRAAEPVPGITSRRMCRSLCTRLLLLRLHPANAGFSSPVSASFSLKKNLLAFSGSAHLFAAPLSSITGRRLNLPRALAATSEEAPPAVAVSPESRLLARSPLLSPQPLLLLPVAATNANAARRRHRTSRPSARARLSETVVRASEKRAQTLQLPLQEQLRVLKRNLSVREQMLM